MNRHRPNGDIKSTTRRDVSRPVSPRRTLKRPSRRVVSGSPLQGGADSRFDSTGRLLLEAERLGIKPTPGKITLLSNDCQPFAIDQEVAYMLETIRNVEAGDDALVPLIAVDGKTLAKALEYCAFNRPSAHRTSVEMHEFDGLYLDSIETDDELLQLLECVNYLDNPSMTSLLSKKVALRMVAEWRSVDAVKSAFGVYRDFTDDEAIQNDSGVFKDLMHRASEIEDAYFQNLDNPPALIEMHRLELLEVFYTIMMARHVAIRSDAAPESRLASMVTALSLGPCERIYESFANPTSQMLGMMERSMQTRNGEIQRVLEHAERMEAISSQFTPEEGRSFINTRLKGEARMWYHDDDPDSDDDSGALDRWHYYESRKMCGDETCGDILRENGRDRIVAPWTGWTGNAGPHSFERFLEQGESHDDAKHEMCRMKGCSRCDIGRNRCVSKHHDKKQSARIRRATWSEFWKHSLLLSEKHK